jgi:cellulose biosynthesis protein BcsQ
MKKAKIIVVATPKGGSGKSTLSILLSVEAAYQGMKVLIFDVDSIGSATSFVIRRNKLNDNLRDAGYELLPAVSQISKSPLDEDPRGSILSFEDSFDLIIIDNRGGAEELFQKTAIIADLVVYPLAPYPMETEQIPKMIEAVKKVDHAKILVGQQDNIKKIYAVINKTDAKLAKLLKETKDILAEYEDEIEVSKIMLPQWVEFAKVNIGTTVSDEKTKGRAKIQLLLADILKRAE